MPVVCHIFLAHEKSNRGFVKVLTTHMVIYMTVQNNSYDDKDWDTCLKASRLNIREFELAAKIKQTFRVGVSSH